MTEERDAIPQSAMVIMAHPDDPEFFCGGTVATFTKAGCEVRYVLITSGNKGSDDPSVTGEQLAATREKEQLEAARRLGVKEVIFLRYNDGELFPDPNLRRDIVQLLRKHRPEAVICQDPTTYYWGNGYINHPDHRAAGENVLAAVFPLARDRLNFPEHEHEGLQPHRVRRVYIAGNTAPDFWVDITACVDTKIEAIAAHESQIKEPAELARRIKERGAKKSDNGRVVFQEGFRLIMLN